MEGDILENASKAGKINCILHKDFLDLIAPSFGGVEDMRIWRPFLPVHTWLCWLRKVCTGAWLAQEKKMFLSLCGLRMSRRTSWLLRSLLSSKLTRRIQRLTHCLSNFHEDCVWSQELLRKVLSGEDVPRTITIRGMSLLGSGFLWKAWSTTLVATGWNANQSKARASESGIPKLEAAAHWHCHQPWFSFSCQEAPFNKL